MVRIRDLAGHAGQAVTLHGWVYNTRSSKGLVFIILRDGTGLCQCVAAEKDLPRPAWEAAADLTRESSVRISGVVMKDDRSPGGYELRVQEVIPIQIAHDYPITPKEHGIDFLMDNRHLWLRSQRQWAAMQIRDEIIYAIHRFFHERGFIQLDAPIFTGNAAEGTTTLFETAYFDQPAYLTQSGQLYAEAMAMAHGSVYTFGPVFRAEKSKTRRHLTEFWMIEPEMAFYDLEMDMDLAEAFISSIVRSVLENKQPQLKILERDTHHLENAAPPFPRISYSEAVDLLKSDKTRLILDEMEASHHDELKKLEEEAETLQQEYGQAKKGRKVQIDRRSQEIRNRKEEIDEDLRNIPVWRESALNFKWGNDFGGSDETLLTMQFDKPVMVHRYPAGVKAFYMKRDPEDDRLALAVDVLAPEGYGEIVGGSQREDDLDVLQERIRAHHLPEEAFGWYLDLRRFGSVPHSGFGLGLERTLAWICGLKHVRETIPFPRMLGRLKP